MPPAHSFIVLGDSDDDVVGTLEGAVGPTSDAEVRGGSVMSGAKQCARAHFGRWSRSYSFRVAP